MRLTQLRQIHVGGRFVVLRAQRDGMKVVVKTLRPDFRDAKREARLRQAYLLLRGLDVPGVVRPLSMEELDGRPALILADVGPVDLGLIVAPGVRAQLEATLQYLAPEQTGRMKRMVDQQADLYALGATFYQMLVDTPPAVSSDPLEVVHAHLAQVPVPPIELRPERPRRAACACSFNGSRASRWGPVGVRLRCSTRPRAPGSWSIR